MVKTNAIPGRTIDVAGEKCLYFSGTSYLGMTRNREFTNLIVEGLHTYGNTYSSSRNSNVQLAIFEEAEYWASTFAHAEAALTMSSGYMAGQVVIRMLEGQGPFLYAPDVHPALWRTPADFIQGRYHEWAGTIQEQVRAVAAHHLVILTNALDPLLALSYSFQWIYDLPDDKEYTVVIDDSHGLGVTGPNGAGIYQQVKAPAHVTLVVVGSMGKALGIPAGLVLSSAAVIEKLRHSAFFGGSSPASPAYLYALVRAQEIYHSARAKLFRNVSQFAAAVQGTGRFQHVLSYPVFYTANNALADRLMAERIMISSFAYPSATDPLITRIIINSLHQPDDINELIQAIHHY